MRSLSFPERSSRGRRRRATQFLAGGAYSAQVGRVRNSDPLALRISASNGGTGPLDWPNRPSRPRGRRQLRLLSKVVLADGIVDHVDAAAAGEPLHFGFEILSRV